MSEFIARIRGEIDLNNVEAKLKALEKERSVKLKVELTGDGAAFAKSFSKQINAISSNTAKAGQNIGNQFSIGFSKGIKSVKFNDSFYTDYKKNLELNLKEAKRISEKFNLSNADSRKAVTAKERAEIKATTEYLKEVKAQNDLVVRMQESQSKLSSFKSLDSSKFSNASAYQKMTTYIKQSEDAMKRFNTEISKGETADFSVLTKEMNEVTSATKKAETQYSKLTETYSKLDAITSSNKAKSWLSANSKVKQKDKNLYSAIDSVATAMGEATMKGEYDSLKKELDSYISEAQSKGYTGRSFVDETKRAIGAIATFTGIYGVLQNVMQDLPRQMVSEVVKVDDAMMSLRMATSVNNDEAIKLMKTYSDLGRNLKATGVDVATSATEWLKQGKSIAESEKLAKDSIVLSKIGELSSEDATKTITAAMKSYKLNESQVMEFIDQISAIDMASATDVGGLSNAFNEVAANAKQAGVETKQLLAYAAAIGETTQEGMASVGTSLNAVFSRMGNIKLSRLKDYESGEDLSNVETVLRGVGIALRDSVGEFRDFDDVLDDTANKWSSFNTVTQRAVSNAFAGTHHANAFMVLMQQWDKVQEYINTADSASGQAMEKFSAYQDSLTGKITSFQNSFQSLSNTVLDGDFLKGIVISGTGALDIITDLIDNFGTLNTLIGVAGGAFASKTGWGKHFVVVYDAPFYKAA